MPDLTPVRSRTPRRKRFAQHFLHDPAVIERIVAAAAPADDEHLVEIGPGRGALTARLLARCATLDVIEIDRDLAAALGNGWHDPRLSVHQADALQFDFVALARLRGAPLRIVGNLPYNVSTPLLFHLLRHAAGIEDLHIMLQREVVARLAADVGTSAYGRLTVMLAPYVAITRLFDVGPGAFQPPPRVWSAVARLRILPRPTFEVSPHYGAVVAAAFSHRRKTLRNALRGLLSGADIESAGLDPGSRPERVAPQGFNALAQKIVRSG